MIVPLALRSRFCAMMRLLASWMDSLPVDCGAKPISKQVNSRYLYVHDYLYHKTMTYISLIKLMYKTTQKNCQDICPTSVVTYLLQEISIVLQQLHVKKYSDYLENTHVMFLRLYLIYFYYCTGHIWSGIIVDNIVSKKSTETSIML